MKKIRTLLFVPYLRDGLEPSQCCRPCWVYYTVNEACKQSVNGEGLYHVESVVDAHTGTIYDASTVFRLNENMDHIIVSRNKRMVEFARVELHTDITKPKPKAKPKPSPAPNPAQYDLLPDIP